MEYRAVDLMQRKKGQKLRINYTHFNFVRKPCKMALKVIYLAFPLKDMITIKME